MSAVTPTPTTARRAFGRLRTAAVVAALACASNGAYAAFASVVIDDFFFSATPGNGTSSIFAPTDTQSVNWNNLQTSAGAATTGGPLSDIVSPWPIFATRPVMGPQASVNGTFQRGSDPTTSQPTPSFSLSATANPLSNGVLYAAQGQMYTPGAYCFYDSALDPNQLFDGTSTFCTGLGSIDFVLSYSLNVVKGPGSPPTSAYADLTVEDVFGSGAIAGGSGSFTDFASTVLNTGSKLGQQIAWTADLAAGGQELFSLTGNVVVQAVPEPGILALAALGLVGLAATRRRSARAAS